MITTQSECTIIVESDVFPTQQIVLDKNLERNDGNEVMQTLFQVFVICTILLHLPDILHKYNINVRAGKSIVVPKSPNYGKLIYMKCFCGFYTYKFQLVIFILFYLKAMSIHETKRVYYCFVQQSMESIWLYIVEFGLKLTYNVTLLQCPESVYHDHVHYRIKPIGKRKEKLYGTKSTDLLQYFQLICEWHFNDCCVTPMFELLYKEVIPLDIQSLYNEYINYWLKLMYVILLNTEFLWGDDTLLLLLHFVHKYNDLLQYSGTCVTGQLLEQRSSGQNRQEVFFHIILCYAIIPVIYICEWHFNLCCSSPMFELFYKEVILLDIQSLYYEYIYYWLKLMVVILLSIEFLWGDNTLLLLLHFVHKYNDLLQYSGTCVTGQLLEQRSSGQNLQEVFFHMILYNASILIIYICEWHSNLCSLTPMFELFYKFKLFYKEVILLDTQSLYHEYVYYWLKLMAVILLYTEFWLSDNALLLLLNFVHKYNLLQYSGVHIVKCYEVIYYWLKLIAVIAAYTDTLCNNETLLLNFDYYDDFVQYCETCVIRQLLGQKSSGQNLQKVFHIILCYIIIPVGPDRGGHCRQVVIPYSNSHSVLIIQNSLYCTKILTMMFDEIKVPCKNISTLIMKYLYQFIEQCCVKIVCSDGHARVYTVKCYKFIHYWLKAITVLSFATDTSLYDIEILWLHFDHKWEILHNSILGALLEQRKCGQKLQEVFFYIFLWSENKACYLDIGQMSTIKDSVPYLKEKKIFF